MESDHQPKSITTFSRSFDGEVEGCDKGFEGIHRGVQVHGPRQSPSEIFSDSSDSASKFLASSARNPEQPSVVLYMESSVV